MNVFFKYFWPKTPCGVLIVLAIIFLFCGSILFIEFLKRCSLPNYYKKVLKWFESVLVDGKIINGGKPDQNDDDIEQINFYTRKLPTIKLDNQKEFAVLNAQLSNSKSYQIGIQRRLWSVVSEFGGIYPLLGILGTLLSIAFSIGDEQDMTILLTGFGDAVKTTIWGIIAGICHNVWVSYRYSDIEEFLQVPEKIRSAIYDLNQKIDQKDR